MNKIIKLLKESVARLDDIQPFLVAKGEKLTLTFLSTYDLSNAIITLQNGEMKETYRLQKEFEVDECFLLAGNLNICVKIYRDDKIIKTWYVSPIRIIETDDTVEMFDLLNNIEQRLAVIEKIHEII